MLKRVCILVAAFAIGCLAVSCGGGDGPVDPNGGTVNPPPPDPPQPPVDKLAGLYGYSQLTDDSEKAFYSHLYDVLSDYEYESDDNLKLYYYDISEQGYNVTKPSLQRVLNRLRDDNPQLFHLGNIVPWEYDGTYVSKLKINFYVNRSVYDQMSAEVVAKADEILECVTDGMTQYDKVKAIHDAFLAKVSYGMLLGNEGTVYGALVNAKAVCEGYARGLQYLYQRAGLQSLYVQGLAKPSGDFIMHAWTIVKVDDKYYYIDSTWDDSMMPGSTGCHWDYFLKSHQYMKSLNYYPMQDPDYPESEMGMDADAFRQSVSYMTVLPACDSNYQ